MAASKPVAIFIVFFLGFCENSSAVDFQAESPLRQRRSPQQQHQRVVYRQGVIGFANNDGFEQNTVGYQPFVQQQQQRGCQFA